MLPQRNINILSNIYSNINIQFENYTDLRTKGEEEQDEESTK